MRSVKRTKLRSQYTKEDPFADHDLERTLYEWIKTEMDAKVVVPTGNVISKARSLDTNFKNGEDSNLCRWVYPFLQRWELGLRVATRKGQKLIGHLLSVRGQQLL